MLEAAGTWPPISESHVEMDGAWALYEAWVRLQHGDVDVALVFASGRASLGASLRETLTFQLDPVLPGADRRRLRVARRAPGPGRARARRSQREGSRRDRRAAPPGRDRQSERRGLGNDERRRAARRPTTSSRRCARTTSARRSTARRRSSSSPATGPRRCASVRRGSRASTIASTRTIPVCATSRARRRRRLPASGRGRERRRRGRRAVTRCARPRSSCSPRRSAWATTSS